MTYYKFLTNDNCGQHSGFDFTEYLPKNGKPGKWLPRIENLVECKSGYHACEKKDIALWLNAQLFAVELKDMIQADEKVVAKEMRFVCKLTEWNDKTARLAACEIAETIAMPIWNKYYPNDSRPQKAIDVSRMFANGLASEEELAVARDAALAALWAVARDDAWDAARDAALAALWAVARDAALAALWAVARDDAWDVARDDAWDVALAVARDDAREIIKKYAGVSE